MGIIIAEITRHQNSHIGIIVFPKQTNIPSPLTNIIAYKPEIATWYFIWSVCMDDVIISDTPSVWEIQALIW